MIKIVVILASLVLTACSSAQIASMNSKSITNLEPGISEDKVVKRFRNPHHVEWRGDKKHMVYKFREKDCILIFKDDVLLEQPSCDTDYERLAIIEAEEAESNARFAASMQGISNQFGPPKQCNTFQKPVPAPGCYTTCSNGEWVRNCNK
jgi:hypothetical protein